MNTKHIAGEPLSNVPSTPQDPRKSPRVLTPEQREDKNRKLRESRKLAKVGAVETPASKAFGEAMAAMKAKPEPKMKAAQKAKAEPKAKPDAMPKVGTQQATIIRMLFRKNGASRVEVLTELNWTAINLSGLSKRYAKRYGYKASQNKETGVTRYFLTKR